MEEMQFQSLGREDTLERKWQPTPVFLPGESHEQRSLAGYSPWGHKQSDTTEATEHTHMYETKQEREDIKHFYFFDLFNWIDAWFDLLILLF